MRPRSAAHSPSAAASTPADVRIYAIGDIHGRADLLLETIARIDDDLERRPIGHAVEVYLGDYIDRGPDSRTVIDLLAARLVQNRAVCLRGNHEALMEDFLRDPAGLRPWLQCGRPADPGILWRRTAPGRRAKPRPICSTAFGDAFPRAHELFLQCLRYSFRCGDFLFVHAGIRPRYPDRAAGSATISSGFATNSSTPTPDHGNFIVHGHTPVPHPDIRHNRINIDTGACWTGILTCIAIEGTTILVL